MSNFKFIKNPKSLNWIISAPMRSWRPNEANGTALICPFCLGKELEEEEVYRIGVGRNSIDWQVRVLNNKFPFAPIHEVIIHSPDHTKSFKELSLEESAYILQVYRERYITHKDKGQVYIFHNSGGIAGESLLHPHSQLVVIPDKVSLEIPVLDYQLQNHFQTEYFSISCPETSEWPDELWIAPHKQGNRFGDITNEEIKGLAFILQRLINIFSIRHQNTFPFNFYIYPGKDWYLRIIPRLKTLGGFEVGTKVFINTQNPQETFSFIEEHFHTPDEEKIKTIHKANYNRGV